MKTGIEFIYSVRYRKQAKALQSFLIQADPFAYLSKRIGLSGIKRIVVQHKPLRYAADLRTPSHIYVDFRQSSGYVALGVAHEYAHLLLRYHRWGKQPGMSVIIKRYAQPSTKYDYTAEGAVEQVLAILLQLSYEDKFKLQKFSVRHARKLMEVMGVWPMGRYFLRQWPNFLAGRLGLFVWLRKSFSRAKK